MGKVEFKSGKFILKGNILSPKQRISGAPAILFVHGWASNQNKDIEYSRPLASLGYVCMTFDLGGHGESGGNRTKISRKEYVEEVTDAYDYLSSIENVDMGKIHVVGSSFGCYLAVILTSKRKVESLLLRAPQNYPDEGYKKPKVLIRGEKLKKWRMKRFKSKETLALRELSKFDGKVLIMESEVDEYIPKQTYQNFLNAVPKKNLKYIYMRGFTHSIKTEKQKRDYIKILKNWFSTKNKKKV